MSTNWGSVPASSVLPFFFNTFNSTGASVTISNFALADVLIYKGTSMTQRSSTAGIVLLDTDGIDLDGTTGIQGFSIDLSDNTDAGFYAVGSFYSVVVGPITVNANTVNFVAGTFRIMAAEGTAGTPAVDTTRINNVATTSVTTINAHQGTTAAVAFAGANVKADTDTIKTQAVTCAAGVTVLASVGTAATSTAQTGDNFARLGAPAGASIAADILTANNKVSGLTFTSAGKVDSNILAINGDATSAANVAKTTRAIGRGTCTTAGSSTTLIATSAFTPVGVAANTDQFAGRVITFDADTTTTKLRGQSTIISSSSAAAAPVFTVTAITIAPVDGDTFSVT